MILLGLDIDEDEIIPDVPTSGDGVPPVLETPVVSTMEDVSTQTTPQLIVCLNEFTPS